MLMSHRERSIDAYIQYKVTVVTGRAMKRVEPFWGYNSAPHPRVMAISHVYLVAGQGLLTSPATTSSSVTCTR